MAVSLNTFAAVHPEDFDRIAKLLVDAGDARSFREAEETLRRYRLHVVASAEACRDPAWQAAIVTVVNCAMRAIHGGVTVALAEDAPFALPLGVGATLAETIARYGGTVVEPGYDADSDMPTIVFGAPTAGRGPTIYPHASQWRAGVATAPASNVGAASVIAAVAAAALAVSECFQRLRGHVVAADRHFAISLWDPEGGTDGPPMRALPAEAWLLGLGHLGQAYAWILALLPYPAGSERRLVLQDDDRLSPANRATSMLHTEQALGARKTRLAAAVLEGCGFETALIERRFDGVRLHRRGDPTMLLAGVDNLETRRLVDDAGFPAAVDAGLGAGPDGYLGMTIRRLPASKPSRELWRGDGARAVCVGPAYEELAALTGDRCGVEQLAGRTVATSFVGVVAAAWVIGGIVRELHGGLRFELIDYSLRTPDRVTSIESPDTAPLRVVSVEVS
jgi:hypothetical protein